MVMFLVSDGLAVDGFALDRKGFGAGVVDAFCGVVQAGHVKRWTQQARNV